MRLVSISVAPIQRHHIMHRGAICQFLFRWIYYCHSSKSTGKKTGKTHLCALVRWDKWIVNQGSDVSSIILFIISYRHRPLKTLYFCICKFKIYIIMFGTLDAWSTIHLSQWTREPAFYIVDWRIFNHKPVLSVAHPSLVKNRMTALNFWNSPVWKIKFDEVYF